MVPFRMGRHDQSAAEIPPVGNLPDARNGSASHLTDVFDRMGFTPQEMVALTGAHSLGGAHRTRCTLTSPPSLLREFNSTSTWRRVFVSVHVSSGLG